MVHARLTKPLYFTDETICLKLEVDNSRSERLIESIDVTFRQTVTYKTGVLESEEGGKQVQKHFDLKMIEFGQLAAGVTTGEVSADFDIEEIALQQRDLREKLVKIKDSAKRIEAVSATVTHLGPSNGDEQLKNVKSESSQAFAKKYVESLSVVPGMRPSHSLLSRGLKEFLEF